MLCGALPLTALPVFAEAAQEAPGGSVVGEAYLAPITVSEDGVTQSGEAVATLTDGDTLLMAVDAVAQGSAEEENGTVVLPTEEGEITLSAGSEEALVTEDGTETAVPLTTAVTEEDGTLYAPVEDLAALCRLEAVETEDSTVYAKPFQTKHLVVRGEAIPDCGAAASETVADYTILSFDSESDTRDAYTQLSAADGVTEVSGENIYTVSDYTADDFPLDENLSWGADYIDSPQLVDYARENNVTGTVTVGIVDTGINTNHSFLKNRIDPKSRSCVSSEPTVEDNNGHGSHVAGIITDNTPENVRILAVKGLDANGQGTDSQLAAGIRAAADNGAEVINMSFGGLDLFGASGVLKSALKYAYDKGVILVAAAGNESTDAGNTIPANSSYCITVAATDAVGEPAFFSNYGSVVDVAAPGVNINSSYKKSAQADNYYRASGTSMATPFVVAACADAQLLHGKMRFAAMKSFITSHVTPYGATNKHYGAGIISLTDYAAVERSGPVVFSVLSGFYTEPMTVTLRSADSDAAIYYTTDGTVPDSTNGTLYTAPLTVDDDTCLKAVAYTDGKYKSKTTKALYQYSDSDIESNYLIDENGVITKYKGSLSVLTVPDKIGGKTVTGIASNAFRSAVLSSIVLPDTITAIPGAAFYGCASLTTVIAKNATTIGKDAFSGCNLKNVVLGKLTEIGDAAFYGNVNLNEESLDLSAVTTVGEHAFYRCPLTVLASDKLTTVGAYAFSETNLVSAKLDNLTVLRDGVFKGCTSLESVLLPKVTTVGKSAFEDDIRLESVSLPQLQAIGERAFYRCVPLSTLATSGVTTLGSEAFVGTALQSLALPKLSVVPRAAFSYMERLESVTLPAQQEVPASCFYHCSSLTAVPACFANVTTVNESAFEGAGLTAIALPKAETVKDNAFKNCTAVTRVSLPECMTFGTNNKLGAAAMTSLSLPKVITFGAVAGSPVKEVSLPCAVSLGANAFSGCSQLQTVLAPHVQSLGAAAFKDCTALTTVAVQNFNGTVPSNCFNGCSALTEVFLPCATGVGYYAFKGCPALEVLDVSAVTALNTAVAFGGDSLPSHIIAPQVITPSEPPLFEDGTLTLTNRTGETLNILCGDALIEQFPNGSSVKLPAGSAVRVLYNGTFVSLNTSDGSTLTENPITFDFTLNENCTLTTTGLTALNAASITGVDDVWYAGAPIVPEAVVTLDGKTLRKGTDYRLTLYHNTKGGTATAVFTGIGAYRGEKAVLFKIKPLSLAKCNVLTIPDQTYTGLPLTPKVTVRLNGNTVTEYTAVYRNNTNVGTATVILTGDSISLTGTREVTFRIKKKEPTPPAPAKNGWQRENGKWYYYQNDVKKTGWLWDGNAWYYLNSDGVMATGWVKLSGIWYYLSASGAMVTGWQKIGGVWYLFASSGAMLTGWQQSGGKWYYLYSSGAMATGWLKLGSTWYYLNSAGAMATGWQYIGGSWYYFNSSGSMRTASLTQGGKTYYFNASGACTNP